MSAPATWDVRAEEVLPGLFGAPGFTTQQTRYIVFNTKTGEEHGRPKSYAAAKAQADQLNMEEKNNAEEPHTPTRPYPAT